MRPFARFDLLIFDCDGVLVDSETLSMRAHQQLYAELGAAPSDDLWARCFGRKQADIFDIIEQEVGRVAPPELRAELWPRTQALFAAELKPTPGLVPFLETLEAKRCIASSSDLTRIRFSLEVAGLSRFFGGDLFSSQQVARGKPAPDIYLFAASRMGVSPEAAVVIEDSAPGVMAGRAAGARVIGYTGGGHGGSGHGERLREAGAHEVAASWREVAAFLAAPADVTR